MKKFLAILILIFAFCAVAFAQTNQSSSCPTINVRGGGIPKPGDVTAFMADVEGIATENLTYIWENTTGEIIKGQGTYLIEIKLPNDWTGDLTVSVEVKGFPEGCSNTFQDRLTVCFSKPYIVSGFSTQSTKINKAELDNLIVELQNNPTAKAFIIEYFAQNTSQKMISEKIRKTRDYLVNVKGIDEDRFKITTFSLNENQTKFWIIPAGAIFPEL